MIIFQQVVNSNYKLIGGAQGNSSISIIDKRTLQTIKIIELDGTSLFIQLDNQFAWIVLSNLTLATNKLIKINKNTFEIESIDLSSLQAVTYFSVDTDYIWIQEVYNTTDSRVVKIDKNTHEITFSNPIGKRAFYNISHDENYVYTQNRTKTSNSDVWITQFDKDLNYINQVEIVSSSVTLIDTLPMSSVGYEQLFPSENILQLASKIKAKYNKNSTNIIANGINDSVDTYFEPKNPKKSKIKMLFSTKMNLQRVSFAVHSVDQTNANLSWKFQKYKKKQHKWKTVTKGNQSFDISTQILIDENLGVKGKKFRLVLRSKKNSDGIKSKLIYNQILMTQTNS